MSTSIDQRALVAAPRGWETLNASRDVARAQRGLLRRILATHGASELCRLHGLRPSMSFEEHRRAVPVRRFVDFQPWIDRMVEGEEDVLVAGRVEMFARSSGTSARPKYIPVSHDGVRTFQALAGLWSHLAIADVPGAGEGRVLTLTSTARELFRAA